MSGTVGSITQSAARAYSWWAGELRSLNPRRDIARPSRVPVDAIVCADAQGNCVSVQRVSKGRLKVAELDGAAGFDAAHALLQLALAHPNASIGVILPFAACFERRIEIPASARRQAEAILGLDFERSTPFKLSEVYAAHAVNAASSKKGWLTASQFIVKRKIADRALSSVEAHGLKVESLDIWSADNKSPIGLNLLTMSGPSISVRSRPPIVVMGGAIVMLTISALWTGLSRREAALASLEHDVSQVRMTVDAMRGVRAAADGARSNIMAVRAFKLGQPSAVEIINELTHLLPDDVVLNDFKIERDVLEISGLTASSAAIVPVLERSSAFRDVVFSAPVTFDGAANKERFSLRLHLRGSLRALAEVALPGAVQ